METSSKNVFVFRLDKNLETDDPSTEEGLSVPAIVHLCRRILRTEDPLETDDSS